MLIMQNYTEFVADLKCKTLNEFQFVSRNAFVDASSVLCREFYIAMKDTINWSYTDAGSIPAEF